MSLPLKSKDVLLLWNDLRGKDADNVVRILGLVKAVQRKTLC